MGPALGLNFEAVALGEFSRALCVVYLYSLVERVDADALEVNLGGLSFFPSLGIFCLKIISRELYLGKETLNFVNHMLLAYLCIGGHTEPTVEGVNFLSFCLFCRLLHAVLLQRFRSNCLEKLSCCLYSFWFLSFFFAKCPPEGPELILDGNALAFTSNKDWLLVLILSVQKVSLDVVLPLNEKGSLDVVQDPARKTIWVVHLEPPRRHTFKVQLVPKPERSWIISLTAPAHVVRDFQVEFPDDNFSKLVEPLRVREQILVHREGVMELISVGESHVAQ